MSYESDSFKEHHLVRLPLLEDLISLGWKRGQIQCPSPDSDDREWRVPKNPSSAAAREKGGSFDGFPVDLVIFDSESDKGDFRHAHIIFECKAPQESAGLAELETYLSLEPRARLGVWTNGELVTRVYKLPSGEFRTVRNSTLPKPGDNLLLSENVGFSDLTVPDLATLTCVFEDLLDLIVASDGRSTRSDARLNQLCNVLLLKLQSDVIARAKRADEVQFQIKEAPEETALSIDAQFASYKRSRRDLFNDDEPDHILFDPVTVHAVVAELQRLDLVDVKPDSLSLAFQVFRNRNLKIGDGQYFTPSRVVLSATKMMCIDVSDKVIDPACGTGGFLSQAYLSVVESLGERDATRWAASSLYGVDRDDINVKLARALMVGLGDGSTNVRLGDSIRQSRWNTYGHGLEDALRDDTYDVVLTNPPFGQNLKLSTSDASSGAFSICKHSKQGRPAGTYSATELGIAFVERAWRLLHEGGRLGIVLPETYFFSSSYQWFRAWIDERFVLKGVLNIPMEAFQGFCRAKTNFYVFVKKAPSGSVSSIVGLPHWMDGDHTWVSNAPTIGINKDGHELYQIDVTTQRRTSTINDIAAADVNSLLNDTGETLTARFVRTELTDGTYLGVPGYCDRASVLDFESWVSAHLPDCTFMTLGALCDAGLVRARAGHGSPSADFRTGDIPYIKVSDLRNRQVNPNRSNMVALAVAKKFWKGPSSGIEAWDIITPARASKNIGEPVMVLPGQERVVLTKEVLVLRAGAAASFDNFYLAWALMLPKVQAQWSRVIFMQTNREDLGERWREIEIPVPSTRQVAQELSKSVRAYFTSLAELNKALADEFDKWS